MRSLPTLGIALLLSACGDSPAGTPSPVPASALLLTCAHVVVRTDLIRGVLTLTNPGNKPVSIVDRRSSWGAYHWEFTLLGRTADNPQRGWYANSYAESILAAGESKVARFTLTRKADPRPEGTPAWAFVLEEVLALDADSGRSLEAPPPLDFSPEHPLDLKYDTTRLRDRPAHWLARQTDPPPRASGLLQVRSRLLDTLEALGALLQGEDGLPRAFLR